MDETKKDSIVVSVRLKNELKAKLEYIAKEQGVNYSDMLKYALAKFCADYEREHEPVPREFIRSRAKELRER